MNYKEVNTKKEYNLLILKVKKETEKLFYKYPEITIYKIILDQLIDIISSLKSNKKFTDNEIYKRYNLGAIAVKNFDCDEDLYGRELQDIFGGLFDYHQMPDK
ncbi:hypothetical protein ETU08_09065 [Apibacter muscae]|uniref:immunity protein Tsi6 family protein n=1 Tax=Apibacter muscae TaxID=2509004 RepID=UPI0011ABF771|nr:immunity protein Tsi6 family protein [Apibacter muscae]TWP28384.1 hypothetical protein ETU08_09065 [Apibacter muscae]